MLMVLCSWCYTRIDKCSLALLTKNHSFIELSFVIYFWGVEMEYLLDDIIGLPIICRCLFASNYLGSYNGERPSDNFYEASKALDLFLEVDNDFLI